jgi:hypothetical protein
LLVPQNSKTILVHKPQIIINKKRMYYKIVIGQIIMLEHVESIYIYYCNLWGYYLIDQIKKTCEVYLIIFVMRPNKRL